LLFYYQTRYGENLLGMFPSSFQSAQGSWPTKIAEAKPANKTSDICLSDIYHACKALESSTSTLFCKSLSGSILGIPCKNVTTSGKMYYSRLDKQCTSAKLMIHSFDKESGITISAQMVMPEIHVDDGRK
jgi:hypothetical protein